MVEVLGDGVLLNIARFCESSGTKSVHAKNNIDVKRTQLAAGECLWREQSQNKSWDVCCCWEQQLLVNVNWVFRPIFNQMMLFSGPQFWAFHRFCLAKSSKNSWLILLFNHANIMHMQLFFSETQISSSVSITKPNDNSVHIYSKFTHSTRWLSNRKQKFKRGNLRQE